MKHKIIIPERGKVLSTDDRKWHDIQDYIGYMQWLNKCKGLNPSSGTWRFPLSDKPLSS